MQKKKKKIIYRAGDILTACDNDLDVPDGLMGHSAIAIDNKYMIEAVMSYPYVLKSPISNFLSHHKKRAVYRPKSKALGEKAAKYARWYYEESESNRQQGIPLPQFSFSPFIPLEDPWASIYCSKLVWLCYYHGTKTKLKNDDFLFTPEDIDRSLSKSKKFRKVYRHSKFRFMIDT